MYAERSGVLLFAISAFRHLSSSREASEIANGKAQQALRHPFANLYWILADSALKMHHPLFNDSHSPHPSPPNAQLMRNKLSCISVLSSRSGRMASTAAISTPKALCKFTTFAFIHIFFFCSRVSSWDPLNLH